MPCFLLHTLNPSWFMSEKGNSKRAQLTVIWALLETIYSLFHCNIWRRLYPLWMWPFSIFSALFCIGLFLQQQIQINNQNSSPDTYLTYWPFWVIFTLPLKCCSSKLHVSIMWGSCSVDPLYNIKVYLKKTTYFALFYFPVDLLFTLIWSTGHTMQKSVFRHMQTEKALIRLHICAVW